MATHGEPSGQKVNCNQQKRRKESKTPSLNKLRLQSGLPLEGQRLQTLHAKTRQKRKNHPSSQQNVRQTRGTHIESSLRAQKTTPSEGHAISASSRKKTATGRLTSRPKLTRKTIKTHLSVPSQTILTSKLSTLHSLSRSKNIEQPQWREKGLFGSQSRTNIIRYSKDRQRKRWEKS